MIRNKILVALESNRPEFNKADHSYKGVRGNPIPSVSTLIDPLKSYEGIPTHILEEAARKGESAHLAVLQYCVNGSAWMTDDNDKKHVERFALFLQKNPHIKIIANEVPLLHTAMGYAGTLDIVAENTELNSIFVLDLKTGSVDASCSWIAQTSLYTELLRNAVENKGFADIKVSSPMVVWTGSGKYALVHENKMLAVSAWTLYQNKLGGQIKWETI